MAYIKIKWRKDVSKNKELNAYDYEKYLLKDRGTELVFDTHNCVAGVATNMFDSVQKANDQFRAGRGGKINIAMEVIHSFSENESKHLGAKKINEMGMELAKKYCPNHQFLVVTHTDSKKYHNHILINPVNEITGKRELIDKKMHLYNLRKVSDGILRERGLSVIKENTVREQIISEKVRNIERRGGNSYKLDLFQKADFARSYATSFDEYVSILHELSIGVAITNKKITYFYGDRPKGIRGDKLGDNYDKNGLINKFKENDERFSKRPYLKERIYNELSTFKDSTRNDLGVSGAVSSNRNDRTESGPKDYTAFTKSDRLTNRTPIPSLDAVGDSLIPISEITKAAQSSIFDYCLKESIALTKSQNGDLVLRNREHIKIDEYSWKNLKNGTKGSLIEFVAIHEETTYLGAISKITGNKNLMLLEQYYGEVKRPYQSFYIPKEKQEEKEISSLKVMNFFKTKGINSELGEDLFKQKRVQVDKKGSIWFYPENSHDEAAEFRFDKDKRDYFQFNHGDSKSHFHSSYQNGKNLKVYTSFLNFLKHQNVRSKKGSRQNELVLMGLSKKAMHHFLAINPEIKKVELIDFDGEENSKEKGLFYNKLKKDLHLFGIELTRSNYNKAITKDRSHSIDF